MKPENRIILEQLRHHHRTLIQAGFMRQLTGEERSGMERIMREEFQPGYTADLWCPACVADMVRMLYRVYDAWLLRNPDPVIPAPIKEVHASFPSHKKHNRK